MKTIGFKSEDKKENTIWKKEYDSKAKIFGEDVYLPAIFDTALNENVLVVGTSGTGKTHSFVEPNILQGYSNYIIADAKGQILKQLGSSLKGMGYQIEVLNLVNLNHSMSYNPLINCKTELDVLSFARDVVTTSIEGVKTITSNQDPFWNNAVTTLLEALIFFVKEVYPPEEQTMEAVGQLFEIINKEEKYLPQVIYQLGGQKVDIDDEDENDEYQKTIGTKLFQWLAEKNIKSQAVKMWNQVSAASGSGKTWGSILGILGTALSPYMLSEVRALLQSNQISFSNLLKDKTALFVIYDDADDSKNFISNILYKQLIRFLYHTALENEDGRLKKKIQFYLDDFKNITIPQFDDYLATARSRNISFSIMVQDESQLVAKFGKNANSIIGNCATYLLTGTTDLRMAKIAEERFSYSAKEIRIKEINNFLVDIGGQTIETKRYDFKKHPNYDGKVISIEDILGITYRRPIVRYWTLKNILKSILKNNSMNNEKESSYFITDELEEDTKNEMDKKITAMREEILKEIKEIDETTNPQDSQFQERNREKKASVSYGNPVKEHSNKPIMLLRCQSCNREVTNFFENCPYCHVKLNN